MFDTLDLYPATPSWYLTFAILDICRTILSDSPHLSHLLVVFKNNRQLLSVKKL